MRNGFSTLALRGTLSLLLLSLTACSNDSIPTQSFEVASKGSQGAALSDDARWAAVGAIHQGGSLWRTGDGERLYNWNHKQGEKTTIVAADFSPEGEWVLTADPHTLVLWNVESGQAARFWTAPGEVMSVALSPGGRFALLGMGDNTAVIFDVVHGGIRRTFHHQNRVRSVDFNADASLAITGSEDYSAVLWDVASGKELQRIQHQDDVQMVRLSADGSRALSAAKYDKALVWSTKTGEVLGEVPLRSELLRRGMRFTAARFTPDGRQLLTGRPDQVVQLWDTDRMALLGRWRLPKRDAWKPTSAAVLAVAYGTRPGRYFAVASNGFVHRLERP